VICILKSYSGNIVAIAKEKTLDACLRRRDVKGRSKQDINVIPADLVSSGFGYKPVTQVTFKKLGSCLRRRDVEEKEQAEFNVIPADAGIQRLWVQTGHTGCIEDAGLLHPQV